ncbi:hypothetical protein GHK86_04885 [Acidimicrobiaceae bacterium USS-CC1]|uniref:DUF389 domain-containing protein n=1 Tax=Acidiferrimicrobium australe TaxID=2664430 RepID=A0ABW9QRH3_9ACTN|nr:hypothetical protein [Acidiferrimicrobium australe]
MNEHSRRAFPMRWVGLAVTLAIGACTLMPFCRVVAGVALVLCVPGASLAAAGGPPGGRLRVNLWAAGAVVVAVSVSVNAVVALAVGVAAGFQPTRVLIVVGGVSVAAQVVGLVTDRQRPPERRGGEGLPRAAWRPWAIACVLLSGAVAVSLVSAGALRQREAVVEVAARRSGDEVVVAVGSTSCTRGQTQRLTVAIGGRTSSWRVHASCARWAQVLVGRVHAGEQVRAVAEQRDRVPATVVLAG